MDDALQQRVQAGLAAVRAQVGFFGEHFGRAESLWKHDGTRVTPADIAISKAIFADLSRLFPEDQFFSEETEPGGGPVPVRSRFCWVLDPIDGTNNYALGIPVCAISLGLLEAGEPVCGFVYDFGARQVIHGGPAVGPVLFADGEPIASVAGRERRPGEILVVAMHTPINRVHMPVVELVLEDYRIRAQGSGALHLTYVALGRVDACLDFTVRVWDVAAACAFCRVTGAEMLVLNGDPFPLRVFDLRQNALRYLAGNGDAFRQLVEKLHARGFIESDGPAGGRP